MRHLSTLTPLLACAILLPACGRSAPDPQGPMASDTHTHADGTIHADHASAEPAGDHAHDEVSLGTVTAGGMTVELAQGHGAVEAGKEAHLVVKLPYTDHGATQVRAWIGTSDPTLSMVGLGQYAASHDDYDVHAVAPTPLPDGVRWWIEIEKPDGTRVTGSAPPLVD